MHLPATKTANKCILLSFLVKLHFETELLPEKRESCTPRICGGKIPREDTGDHTCHRNAYGIVLYSNGNSAEHINPFYGEGQFQPDLLPENTFKGKSIRSHCHALSAETFFPPFRSKAGITYNTNNSETSGQVRNLLGFTGFLVVQTFYSSQILSSFILNSFLISFSTYSISSLRPLADKRVAPCPHTIICSKQSEVATITLYFFLI